MNISSTTDMLIEDLLHSTYGTDANLRQKFIFKEALLGLVRLAKAEQVLEMRTTVEKLIGTPSVSNRLRAKSRARHNYSGRHPQQMEFSQFDERL